MIRASNQVVPKNKVVDHLVLYNFYFGQISGFNVKIGVLGGQTLIKFISNELNPVTVLSSEPYARPCRDPALSPATPRVGRRRSSASAWTRSYPEPYPFRSVPFFLERAEHPSNPSCRSPRRCRFRPPLAAVPRFPRVASRATSPYTFFAPSRARLSPPPAGIEAADRGCH